MQRDPFDIRARAQKKLPRMIFDFIDGGTGCDQASIRNEAALEEHCLQPRALVNVSDIDLSTEFLGQTYKLPFGVAPMGMCNLIAPGADREISKEASVRGFAHAVSTAASTTLEDTHAQADGYAWFQLYAGTNLDFTKEIIARAISAGYKNLIYTIDTPHHSRRTRDLKNGFSVPLKMGPKQVFDFAMHPAWSLSAIASGVPKPMNFETSSVQKTFVRGDLRGGVDWEFLTELRGLWPHNLILKGVTSTKDAAEAKKRDCNAVYVSNHGGRQLDAAPAAINALPKIRKSVGPDFPLIFDSGIRSADDVVRAIALGANYVLLGRPVLFALGAKRFSQFLDLMSADIMSVMAQLGCRSINEINKECLVEAKWENQ